MKRNEKEDEKRTMEIAADEMRRRSVAFWQRKDIIGAWPIAPKGQTFLGHAVHRVGEKLFQNWDSKTPANARLPVLDGSRAYIADGFDGEAAAQLLVKYGNVNPSELFQQWGNAQVGRLTIPPRLLDAACGYYNSHVAETHRMTMLQMATVMKTIIEGAAQEALPMSTRSRDGALTASPAKDWSTESAYARFAECQMDPANPMVFRVINPLDILLSTDAPPVLLDGNEWIFVEAASLNAFVAGLQPVEGSSEPVASKGPKRAVSDSEAREWWSNYIGQFQEPNHSTYEDAADAWIAAFPFASKNWFRNNLWPKRPNWWPRRVTERG